MWSKKYPNNEICPRCGLPGTFKEVQQRIYLPTMTKQKLISRITRCSNCNEPVGTVLKCRPRKECKEDV